MAAKINVFLTLVLHVLLLLYTGVISSTSDGQPLIDRAQEKLDDMTPPMRKSGYGLTASILHANLKRFIHECGFMRSNITIFAPRDEAVTLHWTFRAPFPVQILIRRIEAEDFWSDRMVKGTFLYPACEHSSSVNVTEDPKFYPGRLSIGNARVLHRNIYRDDLVVVHGVDSFFDFTSYYHGYGDGPLLPPWIFPWENHLSIHGWTFERVYGNQSV